MTYSKLSCCKNAPAKALLLFILTLLSVAWSPARGLLIAQVLADTSPKTIEVGREYSVKTIAAAARLARDGDIIEIVAGDYEGDSAVWTQSNLTIRGVNGRPRLIAAGELAEEKAIWVIRGDNVVVENIEFTGARVSHRNGAGIRFERGSLKIRQCVFIDNESGMLVGNDPSMSLEIEDSEFGSNGAGDGQSHNLYVGTIGRLVVQGSYFHHGRVGHLLKSRARENFILYNRLSDEPRGTASYELEFPVGGFALVMGNLIQQGETTQNPRMISFGAEGYKWARNELYLAHNTIVNDRAAGGSFVVAHPGASAYVNAGNNILVGTGELEVKSRADIGQNWSLDRRNFVLELNQFNFRLRADSDIIGAAENVKETTGLSLRPTKEYKYPVGTVPLPRNIMLSPGAFQNNAK